MVTEPEEVKQLLLSVGGLRQECGGLADASDSLLPLLLGSDHHYGKGSRSRHDHGSL